MKIHRLHFVLTGVNLMILVFLLTRMQTVEANDVTPVLRGRGLELVDEKGRLRAEIKVLPPSSLGKTGGSSVEANPGNLPRNGSVALVQLQRRP